MFKRLTVFFYGVSCYAIFFATFLYAIGFIGNFWVPRSIDSPAEGGFAANLTIDLLLLLAFALQHSVMARQGFKRWWTRIVPPSVERSTRSGHHTGMASVKDRREYSLAKLGSSVSHKRAVGATPARCWGADCV